VGREIMSLKTRTCILLLLVTALVLPAAAADRTTLRPGWNLFSTQQDIEMGRRLSRDFESRVQVVNQSNASAYIDALGKQLAVHAPGERFPYEFKIIDDDRIDAFALPGGYVYVTSGLMQSLQSEPELAGIIAHEIGHVVLRHGTQQVSNSYRTRNPARSRISVQTVMDDLNITADSDSLVFKHSREAERQADLLGTQIMLDTGFDPRQMTQAFQRIANENSDLTGDFFNNHPTPPNRVATIRNEMQKMGGMPRNLRGDSPDFHSVQEHLFTAANDSWRYDNRNDRNDNRSNTPSNRMVTHRWRDMEFRYPENWRIEEEADGLYAAPEDGFVSGSLAYGMRIASFQPTDNRLFGRTPFAAPNDRSDGTTLTRATNLLIDELQRSNPAMRVVRSHPGRRVDGQSGMVTELSNDSPLGGRETNWLVTVMRPDGSLDYFVGVAPERDFSHYQSVFDQIISSVRFTPTW